MSRKLLCVFQGISLLLTIAYAFFPALSRRSFATYLDTGHLRTDPSSPITYDNGTSRFLPNRPLPPLLIIPGFEGSLLVSPENVPLFLTPLTLRTFPDLVRELLSPLPLAWSHNVYDADYPRAKCIPSPFSHVGHCHGFPSQGPMSELYASLKEMGYRPGLDVRVAGYDWRKGPTEAVGGSWGKEVKKITETLGRVVIVSHGYGCVVAREWLGGVEEEWVQRRVQKLWCLGGTQEGMVGAIGMVLSGFEFWPVRERFFSPFWNIHPRGRKRIDSAAMDFEMGLKRKRRQLLPQVEEVGLWVEPALKRRNVTLENGDAIIKQTVESSKLDELMLGDHPTSNTIFDTLLQLARSFGSLWAMIPWSDGSDTSDRILVRVNSPSGLKTYDAAELASLFDRLIPGERNSNKYSTRRAEKVAQFGTEVVCVYGAGVETLSELNYNISSREQGVSLELTEIGLSDGDGVVTSRSALKGCSSFGEDTRIVRVLNTSHFDLVGLTADLRAELREGHVGHSSS